MYTPPEIPLNSYAPPPQFSNLDSLSGRPVYQMVQPKQQQPIKCMVSQNQQMPVYQQQSQQKSQPVYQPSQMQQQNHSLRNTSGKIAMFDRQQAAVEEPHRQQPQFQPARRPLIPAEPAYQLPQTHVKSAPTSQPPQPQSYMAPISSSIQGSNATPNNDSCGRQRNLAYSEFENYNRAARGWGQVQDFYRPITFTKPKAVLPYTDF